MSGVLVASADDLARLESMVASLGAEVADAVAECRRLATQPMLLTEAEAAALVGVPRTTLYRLRSTGVLRLVTVEGTRRYVRSELEEFVSSLSASPSEAPRLRAIT